MVLTSEEYIIIRLPMFFFNTTKFNVNIFLKIHRKKVCFLFIISQEKFDIVLLNENENIFVDFRYVFYIKIGVSNFVY